VNLDIRKVEIAWRLFWMRAIAAMLPGKRTATVPNWNAREYKVLFLRFERIGDMIMATGMIRALGTSHPNIKLDVLAHPSAAPILYNNPHVRKVYNLDRKSLQSYKDAMRDLHSEKYDVIVDGRINNPPIFTSTPMLMLAAGAPYRVGVGGGNNDLIYNIPVKAYDRSTPYIQGSQPLAEPFGVDVSGFDWRPQIFLTDQEKESAGKLWEQAARQQDTSQQAKRLLVNLSASEPRRRWPDGKFISVLKHVRSRFPDIAMSVIGLPNEWASVKAVAQAVNALPVQTPKLREAIAMVGTCDVVFTPDTSISHAASAFIKPALVLLKRDHHPYAPYKTPGEIILWDGDMIQPLPYEQVAAALERVVSSVQ
jgi:ADP-heptose:LPS heptosyltransferase